MRLRFFLWLLAALSLLPINATVTQLKVAVVAPLTGTQAELGRVTRRIVQYWRDSIHLSNETGYIGDVPVDVQLRFADTQSGQQGAVSAVSRAVIDSWGPDIVLSGPGLPAEWVANASIHAANQSYNTANDVHNMIPTLGYAVTADDLTCDSADMPADCTERGLSAGSRRFKHLFSAAPPLNNLYTGWLDHMSSNYGSSVIVAYANAQTHTDTCAGIRDYAQSLGMSVPWFSVVSDDAQGLRALAASLAANFPTIVRSQTAYTHGQLSTADSPRVSYLSRISMALCVDSCADAIAALKAYSLVPDALVVHNCFTTESRSLIGRSQSGDTLSSFSSLYLRRSAGTSNIPALSRTAFASFVPDRLTASLDSVAVSVRSDVAPQALTTARGADFLYTSTALGWDVRVGGSDYRECKYPTSGEWRSNSTRTTNNAIGQVVRFEDVTCDSIGSDTLTSSSLPTTVSVNNRDTAIHTGTSLMPTTSARRFAHTMSNLGAYDHVNGSQGSNRRGLLADFHSSTVLATCTLLEAAIATQNSTNGTLLITQTLPGLVLSSSFYGMLNVSQDTGANVGRDGAVAQLQYFPQTRTHHTDSSRGTQRTEFVNTGSKAFAALDNLVYPIPSWSERVYTNKFLEDPVELAVVGGAVGALVGCVVLLCFCGFSREASFVWSAAIGEGVVQVVGLVFLVIGALCWSIENTPISCWLRYPCLSLGFALLLVPAVADMHFLGALETTGRGVTRFRQMPLGAEWDGEADSVFVRDFLEHKTDAKTPSTHPSNLQETSTVHDGESDVRVDDGNHNDFFDTHSDDNDPFGVYEGQWDLDGDIRDINNVASMLSKPKAVVQPAIEAAPTVDLAAYFLDGNGGVFWKGGHYGVYWDRRISNRWLKIWVALNCLPSVIITAVWAAVTPMRAVIVQLDEQRPQYSYTGCFADGCVTADGCDNHLVTLFAVLMAGHAALLLLLLFFFAYRSVSNAPLWSDYLIDRLQRLQEASKVFSMGNKYQLSADQQVVKPHGITRDDYWEAVMQDREKCLETLRKAVSERKRQLRVPAVRQAFGTEVPSAPPAPPSAEPDGSDPSTTASFFHSPTLFRRKQRTSNEAAKSYFWSYRSQCWKCAKFRAPACYAVVAGIMWAVGLTAMVVTALVLDGDKYRGQEPSNSAVHSVDVAGGSNVYQFSLLTPETVVKSQHTAQWASTYADRRRIFAIQALLIIGCALLGMAAFWWRMVRRLCCAPHILQQMVDAQFQLNDTPQLVHRIIGDRDKVSDQIINSVRSPGVQSNVAVVAEAGKFERERDRLAAECDVTNWRYLVARTKRFEELTDTAPTFTALPVSSANASKTQRNATSSQKQNYFDVWLSRLPRDDPAVRNLVHEYRSLQPPTLPGQVIDAKVQ